jgi:aspartate aminotransferase-like enzyme
MTPSTPCISLIYGLQHQLKVIFAEGLENRFARHARLNGMVHEWVRRNGFEFFAPEGYRSKSLTCVANNREIDVAKLNSILKAEHRLIIDGGYGKLKGKTFRISNMGDETDATIASLIASLDDAMSKL